MSKTYKNNTFWVSATIIDDDDEKETIDEKETTDEKVIAGDLDDNTPNDDDDNIIQIIPLTKKMRNKNNETDKNVLIEKKSSKNKMETNDIKQKSILKQMFTDCVDIIEIGIDEAGRGPMFGRVYAGVVVLPKDDSFNHYMMKDSKKFHSKKKIEQVAEYIKENAIAWAVEYEDEETIDNINILQATQSAMHKGIKSVLSQLSELINIDYNNALLLVDGNYFKPFTYLNKNKKKMEAIKYELIEGGDNKYTSIAAASILAKVERDKYIDKLCEENPELIENYGIDTNKGYGSKKHMDGIKKHGITKWHRKTFGICKEYC